MSDNANKMGTSMESIQNAYQGFAKQNYTMLDNLKLGYGGTKEEMERLIEDANRVKEANGEMANLSIDSFADVTEAIHIIQTEMGITGTTATEASTTIEGSVNSMKSAWENLVTDLGKGNADIGESVDELMDSVETALDNIIPAVQQILENITTAIPEIIPRVIEGLSSIITEVLPSLL
jgi:phage-related protein